MKKSVNWILAIALTAMVIAMLVIGIGVMELDADIIQGGAYVMIPCWTVAIVCLLYKRFTSRCPHCGKNLYQKGKYCPECGQALEKTP